MFRKSGKTKSGKMGNFGTAESTDDAEATMERTLRTPTKDWGTSDTLDGAKGWIVPVGDPGSSSSGYQLDDPESSVVGGLFSTRKPRDMGAGVSSGLKSLGKGLAAGAVSLVVCPIVGAKDEGLGGFFKGIGTGILAAVALPIAGVGIAGYQVSRGLINTPEAVNEKTKGKKWDHKKREWKVNWYSLDEEVVEIDGLLEKHTGTTDTQGDSLPKKGEHKQTKSAKVCETEFYDALEVEPDATQDVIRKQYYKLAKKHHPDKNKGDEDASKRFQKLGEAYQVLGDEERRHQYDLHGASAATDMPIIDSSLFFMMLFGSDELEPYIGKLKMTMFVEIMDTKEPDQAKTEARFELEQRKREINLAVSLRERLEGYLEATKREADDESNENKKENCCDEDINKWKQMMFEEASKLCESSFGDAIVEAVGWVYENYSTQFLGKMDTFWGLGGRYAKMQAQGRSMGNSWKTASSAVKAALAARKLQQKEKQQRQNVIKEEKKTMKKKNKNDKNEKNNKKSEEDDAPTTSNRDSQNDPCYFKDTNDENETTYTTDNDKNSNNTDTKNENNDTRQNNETTPNVAEDGTATEDIPGMDNASSLEETLPLILETMLNICLMDIEDTVRAASKKVLKDMAVDMGLRRRRAEGLCALGQVMQESAVEHRRIHINEKVDARRQMEEAFIKATQKADEREHETSP